MSSRRYNPHLSSAPTGTTLSPANSAFPTPSMLVACVVAWPALTLPDRCRYEKLATSWVTQSRWGLGDAVAALEDHPLAARIKAAWADFTTVTAPSTAGMERIRGGQVVTAGRFSLAFDEHTGALTYLEDGTTGVVWVNSTTPG